jgi:CHAT domain-containing protein/Tfp pilus assembly protein PilF
MGLSAGPLQAEEASAERELPAELAVAEQLYREQGPEAAQAEFLRLSALYRDAGDLIAEATAVRFIGEIHWRLGDYEAAGSVLGEAIELAKAADDRNLEAKALNVLGLVRWDLGEYDAALDSFSRAEAMAETLGDRRLQGAVLNNAALVRDELGQYRESLAQYQRVLSLYQDQDFARGEGDTLGNIGGVHLLLGQYRQALEHYQRALAISEALQSVTSMSQDHGNIALSLLGMGDLTGALQHFQRAIELAESAGMRQDVAFWMRGKANAMIRQGQYQQGLELHRAAVELYAELKAKTEAVEASHDLGAMYLSLGDPASAEDWFERSMALAREIGLSRGITTNLLALGDLQVRRQGLEEADALYRQAWQRAREGAEMMLAAEALLRLSVIHLRQQRYAEAAEEASQALAIAKELEAPYTQSAAQFQLGETSRMQGEHDRALEQFQAARDALPDVADPELSWQIHYGAGLSLAAVGQTPAAIRELQAAIELIEGVRNRLEEQRFRVGYVQDKFQVYADLVRLQMSAGRVESAFSTAERLRARSYLDLVERDVADPTVDRDLAKEIELRERIRRLRDALSEENALPAADQRQPAIIVFNEELQAAERAYESLLDDRRRLGASRRIARVPTYKEVKDQLAEGEGLVEYVVAEDQVMIFVLTREGILAVSGDMGRDRLSSRVELLRDLIRRPDGDRWMRPAASLADVLLGPLEQARVLANLHHLYVVPHGTLNYLPFSLLPSSAQGDRLVLEDFTIDYLPTAAALLESRIPGTADQRLLAVAPARSGLQHAQAEANAVFELFHPDSRLLMGDAATETLFKSVAGDYGVLHLATHGYFNKLNPLLSGLELEADADNDGLLELHEILGLKLDADLVTLSACQTGLGSGHFAEIPAGDDFVGLTRAFLYAGSEAVMATLWEVDDASTAELMRGFYERLRVSAEMPNRATALAEAQRELRATEKYRHPYYWAPFVLMGASRSHPHKALGA